MDNADLDLVMFCENILDTHIPDEVAENSSGQLGMEEWLQHNLSNQRPTQDAAELLHMLAKAQQQPELAEGLDRTWQREQISVLVGDIFRKRNSPIELHEMLFLPRLQRLGRQRSNEFDWRKFLPTGTRVVIFVVLATLILLCRSFLN
jgi:hypothetical protein